MELSVCRRSAVFYAVLALVLLPLHGVVQALTSSDGPVAPYCNCTSDEIFDGVRVPGVVYIAYGAVVTCLCLVGWLSVCILTVLYIRLCSRHAVRVKRVESACFNNLRSTSPPVSSNYSNCSTIQRRQLEYLTLPRSNKNCVVICSHCNRPTSASNPSIVMMSSGRQTSKRVSHSDTELATHSVQQNGNLTIETEVTQNDALRGVPVQCSETNQQQTGSRPDPSPGDLISAAS